MSDDAPVLVALSEEEAYMWIKICRMFTDNPDLGTPQSLLAACDRVSLQITRGLTQAKAS